MKGLKDKITGKFILNVKDKVCLCCEKVFHPHPEKQKYCSKKCEGVARTKDKNRNCVQCGHTFWASSKNTRFCSQKCYTDSGIRAKKGADNHLWRGGITKTSAKIRNSTEYKLWRKSVFERDNYTCVWCGDKNGEGKVVIINADHIKPFALFPELRFAIDNGRTLCLECHKTTDSYLNKNIKKHYVI